MAFPDNVNKSSLVKERDELILWVNNFANEMKAKLLNKQDVGWAGWKSIPETIALKDMKRHVKKMDWVDVANFAMFLWRRKKVEEEK